MWGQGSFVYVRLPHNGPHTCQDSSPVTLSTKSTSGTSQAPPSVLTENCWQSTLWEMQTETVHFQEGQVSRQNESGVCTSRSFWVPRATLGSGILVPPTPRPFARDAGQSLSEKSCAWSPSILQFQISRLTEEEGE